jgi:uncharacterized phage protein (TIGR01671 family)
MRDIEFRGKQKNKYIVGNKWVYGLLCPNIEGNKKKYPFVIVSPDMRWYEVIQSIIGQYTGLKDEKGNKIFNGDIVKDPKGQYGVVFWQTNSACFAVNWKMQDGTYETDTCIGYGEVIGNIHDNPDLLK